MSQNLQNFAKFQKFQLDNLVDFEKCCKARIYFKKSVPIRSKTSNMLPKSCQKLVTTLRDRAAPVQEIRGAKSPPERCGDAAESGDSRSNAVSQGGARRRGRAF